MTFLVIWIIASIAVAYAAAQRGRSAVAWFLISALLSPVLGVLLLLACPALERRAARPIGKSGRSGLTAFCASIAIAGISLTFADSHPAITTAGCMFAVGLLIVAILFASSEHVPSTR